MSTTASKAITRMAPPTIQNRRPMPGAVGKKFLNLRSPMESYAAEA